LLTSLAFIDGGKMGFSENGKLTPLAGDASVFMAK